MSEIGKKYLFIHIFKCAGNSIKKTLRDWDDQSKEVLGAHTDMWDIYQHHKNYSQLEEFGKKFKFVIVRNPYDWLASTFFYIQRAKAHNFHQQISTMTLNNFIDWFIDFAMKQKFRFGQNKYLTMKQFITEGRNVNSCVMVDFIGKTENMKEDWKVICENIGIEHKELPFTNINPQNKNNYKELFNQRAKNRIRNVFKEDFEYFDYKK